MRKQLEGNTATLVLAGTLCLTISVDDAGDKVSYQFSILNDDTIHEAEIEYLVDEEDNDSNELKPAFTAIDGNIYFIDQFLIDNI